MASIVWTLPSSSMKKIEIAWAELIQDEPITDKNKIFCLELSSVESLVPVSSALGTIKGLLPFFIKEMSPTLNETWLIRMSQTCEDINRPLLVLASACDVVSGDSYAHIQERNVIVAVKNFWNC